jgi:hypothetical protein
MKTVLAFGHALLVVVMGTVTAETLPGDIDGDGSVSFNDLLILSENFGKSSHSVTTTSTFSERGGLPREYLGWWGLEEAEDWLDGFGQVDLVGAFPSGCMFVTHTHIHYDVRLGFWEGHYWESVPYTYDARTGTVTIQVDGEPERWDIAVTREKTGQEEFYFTKEQKRGGRVIRRVTIMWDRERDHRKPDFWTRNISGAYTKPSAEGFIPAPTP